MYIDWNSVESLKSLRAKIDKRLNQLVVVEKKHKKSHESVFESCHNIFNKNIENLYSDIDLSADRKFYVYVHCDPFFKLKANTNGKIAFASSLGIEYLPFYVGKGVGDRAYNINRNESHHKKRQFIEKSGKSIQIKILKDGLTESEALMMESKLIDIFGLVSFGGWLVNLDEGINNESRKEMYMEDYMNINKMLKMLLTQ